MSSMSRTLSILLWGVGLALLASSGQASAADGEQASSAIRPPNIEVLVYRNPEEQDELPPIVPVVVSFKGDKPSVAFQLGCGSNNPDLLEGFGFAREFDIETVPTIGSLKTLREELKKRAGGKEVPLITLRCDPDPKVMRQQIFQVYRLIDADPKKGPAFPYLIRFRDSPDSIYSVECLNPLTALFWSRDDGRDLAQVSIPINQAVYDSWVEEQGIQSREIHCNFRTARPLPPVHTQLDLHPDRDSPEGAPQLFKVKERFDGISSAMVLYLISGGKGYAIDCNASQDELKQALGLDPSKPIAELKPPDPRWSLSDPHKQPTLRCHDKQLSSIEVLNEPPGSRYFLFNGATSLVRFSCPETTDFFSSQATELLKVPQESLPYLFVDQVALNTPTPILDVGCVGPSQEELKQLRTLFVEVFGRDPTTTEVTGLRSLRAVARRETSSNPAALAQRITQELERKAEATELELIIQRAVESARVKPATEVDVNKHSLRDYLRDKVLRRFGAPERANFTRLKQFIEERSPRLEARLREHYLSTSGVIPTPGAEKVFLRELMEAPEDRAGFEALQLPANQKLLTDFAALKGVVDRAIHDGKRANRARPQLDGGKVLSEDSAFFMLDIRNGGEAPLRTGIYRWVRQRVEGSHAAPRSELVSSYNLVFGCDKTRREFGPCPAPEGLFSWTKEFYDPTNQDEDFSTRRFIQGHESYLKSCTQPGADCGFEFGNILARACSAQGLRCDDPRHQDRLIALIRGGTLCPNFKSIACYVRTRGDPRRDPARCHYPSIQGGQCP